MTLSFHSSICYVCLLAGWNVCHHKCTSSYIIIFISYQARDQVVLEDGWKRLPAQRVQSICRFQSFRIVSSSIQRSLTCTVFTKTQFVFDVGSSAKFWFRDDRVWGLPTSFFGYWQLNHILLVYLILGVCLGRVFYWSLGFNVCSFGIFVILWCELSRLGFVYLYSVCSYSGVLLSCCHIYFIDLKM